MKASETEFSEIFFTKSPLKVVARSGLVLRGDGKKADFKDWSIETRVEVWENKKCCSFFR